MKLRTFAFGIAVVAAVFVSGLQAAPNTPKITSIDDVSHVQMPTVDRDVMRIIDDQERAEGLPPRYAVPHPTSITPDTGGTWDVLSPETRLWRLRVSSPGAVSINIGFTQYEMPAGASVVLRSLDGRYRIRPFTDGDNNSARQLWTPPVAGDDIVIELTIPTTMLGRYSLEVGSINIGYRGFGSIVDPNEVTPRSGSCNVDVICSTGDPWRLQIPAVANISTGGSTFCTGSLLNNTSNDRKPYFLTAFHCGITSGNAASLVAFWNYENSTCRGIPGGGGVGDGTETEFSTGATFRSASSTSDFTLVEFNAPINPTFMVSYLGWDRTDTFPPSGACIHHPSNDEKRITLYDIAVRPDRPSHGSSWGCSVFPGPGDSSHISVYWSLGVTEPGSSGSPLFDNNKRVIGQLHGGPSACGQTGDNLSDCYGRVFRSWTGGGTAATRLSDWLDPGNTGATAIDTISGAGLSTSPTGNVTSVGVVGGPFTNASTLYTISNPGTDPANYTVSFVGGGTAPLTMNGGAGPLGGTLNPTQSTNVTIAIDTAAANALSAGIYSTTVRFLDTTNNITMDRVHTIEIGQTGFTTTPANGLAAGGPVGGPFGATQVYTLTSTQPTPVNITISSNQPWISINGVAGPVNINLNGLGASTNVTIGYSAAANSLASGLYTGTVTITNASGGSGNTIRPVSLDVGRYSYSATDVPQNITDNNTTTSTINVTDSYCIADVNVDINITHTFQGDLYITLQSPIGTTIILHNRTGGGTDNIVGTYDDSGPLIPAEALGTFNGEPVNGTWTLRVADQAGGDVGTLNSWTLKIASGTCLPPPSVVYSYPLTTNPGWTTQGAWAYGVPTGSCGDPSSGATGSNVYGYELNGCYANSIGTTYYLTTTAINMSGFVNSKLRFQKWNGMESASYDHANIQVSNNGTTWTTVYNHAGGTFQDTAWSQVTYNIAAVADNQPTVYIRWGLGTTDGSVTRSGWNIDDVEILASSTCAGSVNGDVNNDTKVDGADVDGFTKAYIAPGSVTTQQKCSADMDDDGDVDDVDLNALVAALLS